MTNKIPDAEKTSRLMRLQSLQKQIPLEKNRAMEGQVTEILVEGESRRGGQLSGRTGTNKVVNFKKRCYKNQLLLQVKIIHASLNSLSGEVCAVPD